jgi:hypothetical protein
MKTTLWIGAAALLLGTGCMENGMNPGTPLEVTRITPDGAAVYSSGMVEPLRTAVFDKAKFAEYWSQAFANRNPAPALPEVDFSREFVVVAALGERSSGGFAIEVSGADGEKGVEVQIATTAPGKNCVVSLAMTQPVDFVKVARPTSGPTPVTFVEKTTVRDCGS